ncbi:hypothetical protein PYCC9005_005534 [Savitreella phatthalungensis]
MAVAASLRVIREMLASIRVKDTFLVLCFTIAIIGCTMLLISGEGNAGQTHHLGDEAQEHHHRRALLARAPFLSGDW